MIKIDKSIRCLFLGLILDVLSLVMVKQTLALTPVADFILLRSLFCLLLLTALRLWRLGLQRPSQEEGLFVLVRAFAGGFSLVCLVIALDLLPLFLTLSVFYTAPLFAILTAGRLRGFGLKRSQGVGLCLSLLGCWIFMRESEVLDRDYAILWPLAAAALCGFSGGFTKKLQGTSPLDVQLVYNLVCIALVAGFVQFTGLSTLPWIMYVLVGSVAVFNLIMNTVYIYGAGEGNVVVLSSLNYISIPLGAVIGVLVWRELPTVWEGIASTLIIIGGIYAINDRTRSDVLP